MWLVAHPHVVNDFLVFFIHLQKCFIKTSTGRKIILIYGLNHLNFVEFNKYILKILWTVLSECSSATHCQHTNLQELLPTATLARSTFSEVCTDLAQPPILLLVSPMFSKLYPQLYRVNRRHWCITMNIKMSGEPIWAALFIATTLIKCFHSE